MFVKNPKKKEREFQEKVRNIDPGVRDWVFKRYISYAKDQHAFVFLAYRRKLHQMSFSKAEKLGFNLRVGMRKASHYKLVNPATDALELDPEKLGPKLDVVIPCLDPDVKAAQKKDEEFYN
jgi:hypothetical protein